MPKMQSEDRQRSLSPCLTYVVHIPHEDAGVTVTVTVGLVIVAVGVIADTDKSPVREAEVRAVKDAAFAFS